MRTVLKWAVAAACLLYTCAASAATVSYTSALPGPFVSERKPFTESFGSPLFQKITLPQFDPALGTLTGVQVFGEMQGTAEGDLYFCVVSGTFCNEQFFSLTLRIGTFIDGTWGTAQEIRPLACNTSQQGATCGPSPETIALNLVASKTQVPGTFAAYTGTGGIDVFLSYEPAWTFSARADEVTASNLFAGVTYTYDAPVNPVPLPAALPLLIAGLGAMGWMGRRRIEAT